MTAVAVDSRAGSRTRPKTRQQLARAVAIMAGLDFVLVTAAVPVALWIQFGSLAWHAPGTGQVTGVPLAGLGWVVPLLIASLAGHAAYSRRTLTGRSRDYATVLRAGATAALIGALACYALSYDLSRGFYFWFFVVATSLLLLERVAVGRVVANLRRQNRLMHRVVLVGSDDEVDTLTTTLALQPHLGFTVVASVGTVEEAGRACAASGADTLLVASGGARSSAELRRIGWQLADAGIELVVVPGLIDVAGARIRTSHVSGLPFMHIEPPRAERAMKWQKALFDRVGALVLLVALAPVFVVVAAAIRLESRGPVLFRHRRVGAMGNEFWLWKFRSMTQDAEDRHAELLEASGMGALLFKVEADPRVTKVGRFIRRYSVDELPQLVNVLRGEMSLIGPRPQVAAEVAMYDVAAHRRLLVRPGLTGLWQVSGRSNLSWEETVRLDLSYVDNWSMTRDLAILFKTVRAVLQHDGAY